jgi:ribosomal protein S4
MAETVLEHLLRCHISEPQARQHLTAGHVRVNGATVTDPDATLTGAGQDDDDVEKPSVVIYPY